MLRNIVSIHVPTRGTTICRRLLFRTYIPFQSTVPRGERHVLQIAHVSTDTFQSTFPRGERLLPSFFTILPILFQSTFPRGERPATLSCYRRMWESFNPRSHEGNDHDPAVFQKALCVSIHVPTRGTTFTPEELERTEKVSIHVPTRGTTKFI